MQPTQRLCKKVLTSLILKGITGNKNKEGEGEEQEEEK